MALDPTSGKHKGFCFVEYEAPESATVALLHLQGAQLGMSSSAFAVALTQQRLVQAGGL